jgi:hypothetical protein
VIAQGGPTSLETRVARQCLGVGDDKAFFKDGLIRAVESRGESQAFVTADSGKRGIGVLVPSLGQLHHRLLIEIAPLMQWMEVAIVGVKRCRQDDGYHRDAHDENCQIDRIKAFDRIACAADNQNGEQKRPCNAQIGGMWAPSATEVIAGKTMVPTLTRNSSNRPESIVRKS